MIAYSRLRSPTPSPEQEAQGFLDLWAQQRYDLLPGQIFRIAHAYLTHILGVDEQTARDFGNDGNDDQYLVYLRAQEVVGRRMAGIGRKDDRQSFWKAVAEITPDVYSESDLKFLARDVVAEERFLCSVGTTASIAVTAHIYK